MSIFTDPTGKPVSFVGLPTTDDQAIEILSTEKERANSRGPAFVNAAVGLYEIRRLRGDSIEDALEVVLRAMIEPREGEPDA